MANAPHKKAIPDTSPRVIYEPMIGPAFGVLGTEPPLILNAPTLGPLLIQAEELLAAWNQAMPMLRCCVDEPNAYHNAIVMWTEWGLVGVWACNVRDELAQFLSALNHPRTIRGPFTAVRFITDATQFVLDTLFKPRTGNGTQLDIGAMAIPLEKLRLGVEQLRQEIRPAPQTERMEAEPTGNPNMPKVYLMNWRDILAALKMHYNEESQKNIKRLQKQYGGPILMPTQGGQPKVEKEQLLEWWNNLDSLFQEEKNQADGRLESVHQQYQHGRQATVAPEISGHIKKTKKRRK